MSNARRLESLLGAAQGKEKSYDWAEAAKLYEQALGAVGKENFLRRGEIQETIGYCFYRGAFQAESQKEFKRRMGLSVRSYGEAAELYERLEDSKKQAQLDHCRARTSYSKSWLAENPTERTAMLDECRRLVKQSAKVYEEAGDWLDYGKTGSELVSCLVDRQYLAQDWQEMRVICEEALEYARVADEKAIPALIEAGDMHEVARAYAMVSWGYTLGSEIYESAEKQKALRQKALIRAQKALATSENSGAAYLIGLSNWILANLNWDVKGDVESARRQLEKVLELGAKAKDNLLIARAQESLAAIFHLTGQTVEDPDKRRNQYYKTIQTAEDNIAQYELLSYPFTWSFNRPISSYVLLAMDETDLEKKRVLLKKATEIAEKYMQKAKRSGSPYMETSVLHSWSAALQELAKVETVTDEKRRLLEQATEYREAAVNIVDRLWPFNYYDRSMLRVRSAGIKAELAKIETDSQKKRDLLTAAALTMEECLKLLRTSLKALAQTAVTYSEIGKTRMWFGDVLNQLYRLTGEKQYINRELKIYEDAAEAFEKVGRPSRIAEAHWRRAKIYFHVGEHLKAAQAFESASEQYTLAGEKLPQLKAFYTDHAVYMQAWNEIEQAKYHHAKGQYGKATEYYEKAASLHESTARWSYLSTNYSAWARLEEAEDLSRREQTEEARDLFQQAANLFAEAKLPVKTKLGAIEATDEKEMAAELVKASDTRREYSLGRIALENARILDRKGDHVGSSKKYGSAAAIFQKIAETESEQSRKELKPIIYLCQAWQKMMMAEAKASSTIYGKAAELFAQAKEHTLDQPTSLLALAHSSFCKALEAGTEFETTGDITMYSTAKRHLEAAARHYLKAGLKSASEYARATHRLFDAYMYMHKAETETDPRKKAQYYQMTEKLLQASAGAYTKAKHPEKSQEVGRLLESVKEERQLAISLTEVLHAPTIASTTTSFSTPTPTHEQAVGLERFEHADVQANLILRVKEVRVGEDIRLAIEVVNAGKAPALLIKVDEVVPKGFEIREVPEMYTFEDSYINMKGKRLNPLKTEDVKIVVKPRSKGTHTIKPRILYIDETGKYKSHEPEPVTVTVKELGIKGWIKGER